ncbi:glycosyltransferase family 4 protein [Aestuariivirga sp.]|uniref:glycosyltransferase family 4 protein n=1 Tax=Aestuariivirga sp. TaxID=2650926 RepID=UPI00391DAB4D
MFRTPVGGLFRHVRDLARGESALGHEVGLVCDGSTGGSMAEALLEGAAAHCVLGIRRIAIPRLPGLGDVSALAQTITHCAALRPHVIHCHGAKGGLYGRLAARRLGVPSLYAPHGGSLHYRWSSPAGAAFLAAEAALARAGAGLHFVCRFERDAFAAKVGLVRRPQAVIHNGLWPEDFAPAKPAADAADILFIGDMRDLKGVDVLLGALARLRQAGRITACLVGDGPDLPRFRNMAEALGLADAVSFPGRLPAQEAFTRGRLLVMPSRAESFPYVVLEAAAAGVPIVASAVGGIPEVLDPPALVPPGDAEALALRLAASLAAADRQREAAEAARQRLRLEFSAARMVEQVLALYRRLA